MHRECPEGTACYIHHLKQQKRISVNAAIRQYSEESGIPVKTLERWYWPGKVQPKPERKEIGRLERIIKMIEKLSAAEIRQLKEFILDEQEMSNDD